MMDVNYIYWGDHLVIYPNVKSLCCTLEMNIMLNVKYTSTEKKKKERGGEGRDGEEEEEEMKKERK